MLFKMFPSSLENSKLSSPDEYERDNSTFEGEYDTTNYYITIMRKTEPEEQTEDDGSVTRIERGRVLDGYYWN